MARRGTAAILALAAVCLLAAGIGAYAQHAVLDESGFADRAATTLRSDEVREEVAARLAGRVAGERPELSVGRPLMESVAADAVTGDPEFQAAFRGGAVRLHRALFGDPDAEAALVVKGSSAALRTELARRLDVPVPRVRDVPLLTLASGGREGALRRLAPPARDVAGPLTLALGLAGALLLALAVLRERGRRRAVWGAGLAVAAAGGLIAAGVTAAQDLALDSFDTGFGDAVVSDIWNAYVGDLRLWALAAGAAGLVVAAAAGGPRPSPAALLAAPASRGGRAARAAGLLAVAALAVAIPELVLHAALVALAAGLVYVAAGDLLRALAPPQCRARPIRLALGAAALLALVAAVPVV
jgi:hypothetical protein